MPLSPGTTLGPYQVTAKIGEGGMGEVYRARDTKLDRDVALKVLPQAFTEDPDRLARFEREAKVLASLNHPNIGHIYGLEEAEGTRALVLELIEGPTLSDRIAQGPIPVDEALPIAKQIAEALEAAHEAGVIHRDLKPANIKVRDDGTVKVLDFGLAKALDTTPEGDPSLSPTLTAAATQMGVIMGTAAYMSPEQARGKTVDKRTDVWAFGVVLLEMLTGRKVFEGEDVSMTLSSVLQREPDWSHLPSAVSPSLSVFLRRCLEKDPKQRVPDVAAMRLAMGGAFETTTVSTPEGVAPRPAFWRQSLPWVAGLALAVISSLAVWTFTRPPEALTTRFTIELSPSVRARGLLALSPDGRTLAFHGMTAGGPQVHLRRLDQLEAVPLRGAEGTAPFDFSPDGQTLLVADVNQAGNIPPNSSVRRVPVAGGPATTVAVAQSSGAAWGPDDTIVLGGFGGNPLQLVRVPGGEPTPLTTLAEGERGHSNPTFLPNGRAVLFDTLTRNADTGRVAVYDFETNQQTNLFLGSKPLFAPTGHLIFWRDGSLWAVLFDPDRLEVDGDPVAVMEGVSGDFLGAYALADNGTLVYLPTGGGAAPTITVGWVDRNGQMTTPLLEASLRMPRLSPDGAHVAFTKASDDGDPDIWIRDLERGLETRLTESGADDQYPIWSPDGAAVTFMSNADLAARFDLFSRPVDLSAEAELVLQPETDPETGGFVGGVPGSWSPEGTLVFYSFRGGNRDIWALPPGGDPVPLMVTPFDERAPRLSPNGKWVTYVSDQGGEDRVYVTAFPEGGQVFPISTGPGVEAMWSRDGRELFYRNGDEMWAVGVETESGFTVGKPELLFDAPYDGDVNGTGNPNYDVSLDGQTFLMVRRGDAAETPGFVVVQNWHQDLLERVPID